MQPEIPSPLGDGMTSPGTAVRQSARIPSGSNIGLMKNADANANLDHLSFREKMKFFEKEIQEHSVEPPAKPPAKRFSYLAEHEIARMKVEEANKTAHMSSEQLRSYVASGVADIQPDQDLDHVLSGMKSLETDAVHAQAVIAKAQELSRGPPGTAPPYAAVDIGFADDDDRHQNHNGNSQTH